MLKYIFALPTVVLGVVITALLDINVQNWAAAVGLDKLFVEGGVSTNGTPILLAAFLFCFGATVALWLEYFLRRRLVRFVFWLRGKKVVEGKTFRHQHVPIDGKTFRKCVFEGVTLVYKGEAHYDIENCTFNGPFTVTAEHPIAEGVFGLAALANSAGLYVIVDERGTRFERSKPKQH